MALDDGGHRALAEPSSRPIRRQLRFSGVMQRMKAAMRRLDELRAAP